MDRFKLAIQIAGQLRFLPKAFDHYREIKQEFSNREIDCDFFLSCWDREGFHGDMSSQGPEVSIEDDKFFKAIELIKQKQKFNLSSYGMTFHFANSTMMRLNYEKKTGIEYDAVLITRPDLFFKEWVFNNISDSIKAKGPSNPVAPNCVLTPTGTTFILNNKDKSKNGKRTFDLFTEDNLILGHPIEMNKFIHIDNMIKAGTIQDGNHKFLSDFLMRMNLLNMPLSTNISRIPKMMDFEEFKKHYKKYQGIMKCHLI
jgi:hypothetical protein